jgi:RNA polymerase sigma-70 factor, ECF subfamily
MSPDHSSDSAKPSQHNRPQAAELAVQIAREIPFLRRTVRRWHRQKPDADDLVQDTLVQALANAHLWQPGSNLRAWLFTIMRNQFLAAVARSNRGAALLRLSEAKGPLVADDEREARLFLYEVGAVLGRLPMKQRTALRLAGVEGRSYEEVAAAMGLSVGAVRCHLARGRDRLRVAVRGSETSPRARDRAGRSAAATLSQVDADRQPALVMAAAD